MKASVIVASYRRPVMLKQCLASLLSQDRPPHEVIVVTKVHDPESARAVHDFERERSSEWPLVNVQVVENSILAAENAGLQAATGDVACFLDDDAVARQDWLARLLAHYQDERVGAVGGRDMLYVDGELYTAGQPGRVGEITWYGRMYGNHHLGADGLREVCLLKGVNMSVRRDLVRCIDPRLRGDVTYHWEDDLCLSVQAQGYRVLYDPLLVVDHYAGRSMTDRELDSRQILFDNNHNATYVLLKHLPLPRKLIAFCYTVLVGDGNAWGLASVARQILLGRHPLSFARVLGPSLGGKLSGLRTYLAVKEPGEEVGAVV
jgi:GT2 family glycosyltransferase